MQMGINYINKQDFLSLYSEIRLEGLSISNIHKAFRATGLVPYDPELVLAKLYIQLRTPTPPLTTGSSPCVPATRISFQQIIESHFSPHASQSELVKTTSANDCILTYHLYCCLKRLSWD